jgi:membrane protein required for colicin V production
MTFAIAETQGSASWQWIFLAVALLWLLISTARGWSKGLMRQLVSVVALIAAVWITSRFSSNLADYLRTALHLPEGIVTLVAILFLWIVTSNLVVLIGHMLFKRTRDQESPIAKLIYGFGGAFLGFLYGLFFLWLIVIGIRLVGYIAEKELSILSERGAAVAFPVTLAKLKNSIERGFGRPILNVVDPIPRRWYQEIDQWGRAVSDPRILRKMMGYPGFQNVWRDPRVKALQDDPEIQAAAHQGNLIALMSNRKVVALMNDPEIRKACSPEQLQAALDYALNSP